MIIQQIGQITPFCDFHVSMEISLPSQRLALRSDGFGFAATVMERCQLAEQQLYPDPPNRPATDCRHCSTGHRWGILNGGEGLSALPSPIQPLLTTKLF